MKPTQPQVRRKPGRPKTSEPSTVKSTLLQTASALFMQLGFESVSMEQISAASGVTKASVYYYFPNKAELFTAAVVHMMTGIGRLTRDMLEQPGSSFRERLAAVADAHMRAAHVDFESLMREASPALSGEQIAAIREAERSIHVVLAETFQRKIDAGAMRPGDPMLYAYAFSSLLMLGNRSGHMYADGENGKLPPIEADTIVDLFWYGAYHMV
ncbi:TetR/AcrR family transcriptional regulator [Paenibacillus ginsengarvi]|uniref:TetR/AcrR family transcriptional regulator n=1 Tax=Paenibacillus ginsengarvi TaxID=400777 RepID=A0A3B0CIZ3_9BACL|nr:TetR/AcrR family transcriptional regulator [Paenibacillus ginsengarvi]RKN84970.1 TetR/AcrR family transcriptional regulator [Paenibacillus ginsengarvi]